jgi:hypothetical protein
MTALLEFQRTLARAVMQPLSARDNMKRGANSKTSGGAKSGNQDGIALVKPNSRLSSFERLEIYNRSYWSRVIDAFSEDFPGVRAILGARRFDRLRRRYLNDCPSESFTMRDLGKNLVAWMERNQALAGPKYDIALDMAKLEWAEIESFDAGEHERLGPGDIATLGPQSSLRIQPHLRSIEARHEVDTLLLEVREAAKRNGGAAVARKRMARMKDATALESQSVNHSANRIYLAVHRLELVVHYKRLDAEMFRLVKALGKGICIEDAIEFAYSDSTLTPEECQKHIQDSFALFGALGWLCKAGPWKNAETQNSETL